MTRISWPQDFRGWRAATFFPQGAIQEFRHPSLIKELQAFLGIVNFYRRFLPSIAHMLWPLTNKLRTGKKWSEKLELSAAIDAALLVESKPCFLPPTLPNPQ
jgi:hypothetical protein